MNSREPRGMWRLAAAMTAISLALLATALPTHAEPTPADRVPTSPDTSVEGLVWKLASPEFNTATEPISELIHERGDIFSGSLLSSDATYVEIFVSGGSISEAQALLQEAGIDPTLYLLTERVRSAARLEQEMVVAKDRLEEAGIAVSHLALDPVRDGIQVVLSSQESLGRDEATPTEASEVLAGLAISDITKTESVAVDFSSSLDGPSSTGGARLTSSNGQCTAGFGIITGAGVHGQLGRVSKGFAGGSGTLLW